ncbi:MAG TPA: hypothetical protein VFZ15_07885 [Acidimicrobiia bacterium]|nr:hypothetical protein [Acidimicrobiia bacterium]
MHKHDLDLIASFADGTIEDETDARDLVASCDECRAEYHSQLEILEILAAAPPVAMSELEKAALHRDLWTELRSQPSTPAARAPWYRWAYVAAGLFVVVGVAGALSRLPFGAGDAASEGTFVEISSALDGDAGQGEDLPLSEAPNADSGGDESVATTAAAESLLLPFPELAEEARQLRQSGSRAGQLMTDQAEIDQCLEKSGLADQVVVEELELDQRYLVVMAREGSTDQTVTFIALESCEIVHRDG